MEENEEENEEDVEEEEEELGSETLSRVRIREDPFKHLNVVLHSDRKPQPKT